MTSGILPISVRRLVQIGLVVGLVVIVLPFVITGVPGIVGAEESYVVLSGSMSGEPEPDIQPGDVVIVDGVDPSTIEEGDIITYRSGDGQPITHRVIGVQRQGGTLAFQTKGDANEDADAALVTQDQVVGEVTVVFPFVGHVVNFVKTPLGFGVLVVLPMGLLLVSEVWNAVRAGQAPDHAGSGSDGESPGGPDSPPEPRPVTESKTAGTAAASGDGPDGDDGPATVTLKRSHPAVAAVLLAPAAVGAGYFAYTRQTAWAITATYAATGLFLVSLGLYLRMAGVFGGAGSADSGSEPVRPEGSLEDRIIDGSIDDDPDATDRLTVTVASVDALVDLARERRTWVVDEADTDDYYLVTDEVIFRASTPGDEGTAIDPEDAELGEAFATTDALDVTPDPEESPIEYSLLADPAQQSATPRTNGEPGATDLEEAMAESGYGIPGEENTFVGADVEATADQDTGGAPVTGHDRSDEEEGR